MDQPDFIDFELKHLTETYHPSRALDLGAGKLKQSLQMANDGIQVDAVEPVPLPDSKLPSNLTLYPQTIEDFTYSENSYDLVILRMVIQRLKPETVINLFENILPKTLKTAGLLYILVPANYQFPCDIEKNFILRGSHEFDIPTSDFKIIKSLVLAKRQRQTD